MKSEERIAELLAEYLKKADQLLDRMEHTEKNAEQTNRNVDMMSRAVAEHSIKFNVVSDQIKQLREDQGIMFNKSNEDIKLLLKELVSLSKRVAVVEEKH